MTHLHAHLERLDLSSLPTSLSPNPSPLSPGPPPSGAIRKQRSQRFTVTTTPSSTSGPPLPLPTSSSARNLIPSLPYQAPPPPVQSQTLAPDPYSHPYFRYDSSSATTNTPDSLASTTGTGISSSSPFSSLSNSYGTAKTGTRPALSTDWLQQPPPPPQQLGYAALLGRPVTVQPEDDVIPTAIVIKNIAFSVPKETLLGIMEDLQLPAPFAFNYHFDNGQFRGLAFANFRTPQEAALTVSALNGFDLQGRKLRTEFKKVLKEGEKERIERDKALKRMRSQQHLTTDVSGPPIGSWNRREASAPGGYGYAAGDDEDFGRPISSTGYGSPFGTAGRRDYVPAPPPLPEPYSSMREREREREIAYGSSPPSDVGTSISARMTTTSSGSGSDGGNKPELDLNDPQALEIYSRVLIFKDDSFRDELAFARSLSPQQRRIVHLVAQKLNMEHRSVGEGDDRHVVVFKSSAAASQVIRHRASTLGRQASRDFSSASTTSTPAESYGLRGKKSMPDVRSGYAGSPSQRRSNHNLREGYRSATGVQGLFSQFDIPPALPTQPSTFYQSPSSTSLSSELPAFGNGTMGAASVGSPPSAGADPSGILPTTPPASDEGGATGNAMAVRQPKGPDEEHGFAWKAVGKPLVSIGDQAPFVP